MQFAEFQSVTRPLVEAELDRLLPAANAPPIRLHEAMRYSVFAGGKRVRPLLVLSIGEGLGAKRQELLAAAASLELIHTFSLIHDDLPALDDDDLRRGRPTVHRVWDEALAILAGDALLALGIEVLAENPPDERSSVRLANVVDAARATGSLGMSGGQADDLAAESAWPPAAETALKSIHERKTGALIAASLRIGARLAGVSEDRMARVSRLGVTTGLLFQIRDDLLDLDTGADTLGKTPGKDAAANKLTYPALLGEPRARELQQEVYREAVEIEAALELRTRTLRSLLDYLVDRDR
jgi:geranylgeranyl pyrophosphate synthase